MLSVFKSEKKGCDKAFLAVIRSLGSYSSRELIKSSTSAGACLLKADATVASELA